MVVALIFLGTSRKSVIDAHKSTYGGQLFKSIELISSVMSFRLPDTINLYNDNLTEKESMLFQSSLDNTVYTLGPEWTKMQEMESFYNENNDLSEAVENFYILMHKVKEEFRGIDESEFYQIADIVNLYGRELADINYKTTDIIFEKAPIIINNAIKEIQELVKLTD